MRKLLLAQGVARVPHLIVMDEPTNHLDLPSIECLETALLDCPCALLLVSHDERFLAGLSSFVGKSTQEPGGPSDSSSAKEMAGRRADDLCPPTFVTGSL